VLQDRQAEVPLEDFCRESAVTAADVTLEAGAEELRAGL